MTRKTDARAASFPPDEVYFKGLGKLIESNDNISLDVISMEHTQDYTNIELSRIRRANELILGQDVQEPEDSADGG